jgi:ABC-type cobalamin/Fe3+-siderophores transport system ATPase subunit
VLQKIEILNYRCFERFSLDFTDGLNVIVGDNETGKSTILEAVRLALTGRLGARWLSNVISPHHVNQTAAAEFVSRIRSGEQAPAPEVIIDLYLRRGDDTERLRGTNNLTLEDEPGLRVRAALDRGFEAEYQQFISDPGETTLVPIEYYKVEWLSFAGGAVTARSIPASVSRIDASAIRLQSGADYYMQRIIEDHLAVNERVEVTRAYRTLREAFSRTPSIETINKALETSAAGLTEQRLSLSLDVSHRTAWETSLTPHLDELPFHYVGDGGQNALKILLALERTAETSHIVLIEEPENHLSPTALNQLVRRIAERCEGKQVLVSTHSSFVLNKLGLDNLILLSDGQCMRLEDLPPDTLDYFKKLSGYDTLRLVLAESAILVEGPSDELIVQRAFLDVHGCLPIEKGVDVINVRGLSFKRFLDIAIRLGKRVRVITDNDGRSADDVRGRFDDYTADGQITIHTGREDAGSTLEPQMLASAGREALNAALGTSYAADSELVASMEGDKTTWALKVFESEPRISMPDYIIEAIEP